MSESSDSLKREMGLTQTPVFQDYYDLWFVREYYVLR